MTRSREFCRSHWQQALVFVIAVIVGFSAGSQNCKGEPCMYGICINSSNGSYSCYCIDGYTGINCEINWDDCWSDPCLNGASCNDAVASYNCTCPDGFIGLNCEQKYSECMNQPCLNNGTCIDYNGFMCQCPEGYSGEYCEIDASVCNNTICKNFGECTEGPGYSFYCRCTEGWTGLFCEEDVDECLASPCQNGGLCLNTPSTYTCACLFGYTGKDCDKMMVPCEVNICENDAMCLLEDSQPVCYCVPDYHGQQCELRYNDCESKFARCENGGTCIDGINNFTCSCPPEYSGEMCLDYDPTATATNFPASRMTTRTVPLPTMIYTSSSREAPSPTSMSTADFQHFSMSSEIPDDDHELVTTTERSITSTTYRSMRNMSVADSRSEENRPGALTSTASSTVEDDNLGASTTRIYLTGFTASIIDGFESESSTTIPYGITDEANDPGTTTTIISDIGETTVDFGASGETSSPDDGGEASTTVFRIPEISTDVFSTEFHPSATSNYEATIIAQVSTESGPQVDPTSRATWREGDEDFPSWTTLTTRFAESEAVTRDFADTATSGPTLATRGSVDGESRSIPDSRTEIVIPNEMTTYLSSIRSDDEFSTVKTLVATSTSFPEQVSSSSGTAKSTGSESPPIYYNCSQEECANCGKNSTTICNNAGPKIENAAFNGKSYVRQRVSIDGDGSLRIYLRLKTKAKSGVLVHAFFDDERYVLLYMEGGQLKFQFSCGLQTMLLGEIDSPINNGFDVDVEMRFQYIIGTDDMGKCSARLLVNDTMAMSGEQILSSHENVPRQVRIHLGGIPQAFTHYFPRIAMGFVGCMSLLKVNNVPRHFIRDSLETFQIEECTSFLCLLNPCRNFGSCHDIDGQVYCKCISGYSGAICERSACDDNPCYLGATCISSPGTGFICVCPLGMHGLVCQEESAIVQPSFSVLIPGFSSYAAYGLTNPIKDGMELRMRLVPHSVDQISLIAFMGQSGTSRDVPDHFSLTYVRGYIMLTWDLGSGARRIFTKSPLMTRAHRPHTLRVGRRGREAWLSVDGLGNVTGQAAGSMTQLDVSPILYIGGHKARNFDTLPHDLPLHTGFSGCIFDIELRTGDTVSPITKSSPATGRGVAECHRNECSHNACKNGALCLNHGPTYSCVCMKEWEGADCSVPAVTCSTSSPYRCEKANAMLST